MGAAGARGAAGGRALEYLHEQCEPQVVHGDVKASNVLRDGPWTPGSATSAPPTHGRRGKAWGGARRGPGSCGGAPRGDGEAWGSGAVVGERAADGGAPI